VKHYYVFQIPLKERDRRWDYAGTRKPEFHSHYENIVIADYAEKQANGHLDNELAKFARIKWANMPFMNEAVKKIIDRAMIEKQLIDHWQKFQKRTGFQMKAWAKQCLSHTGDPIHWTKVKQILDQDPNLEEEILQHAFDNMTLYEERAYRDEVMNGEVAGAEAE
jgi:hypothetical protein